MSPRTLRLLRRRLALLGLLLALWAARERLSLSGAPADRLRFAHTFTSAAEQEILSAACAELERRHPGLRVEQVLTSSDVYDRIGWRLQHQGRSPPDVWFQWEGWKVEHAAARGWALDLRPHLSPGFLEQLAPAAVPTQGPLYLLPFSADLCNLVWYDQDLFRAQGLATPRTLEEWTALCATLRARGVLPLVQGNRDLWPLGNLAQELLAQELGAAQVGRLYRPLPPGSAGPDAVTPADLAGLAPLVALRAGRAFDLPGLVAPGGVATLDDTAAKVLFLSGQAAQHVVGSWFLADVRDAQDRGELGFTVDCFPVPPPRGRPDVLAAVKTGFLVHPRSPHRAAAVELVELLLSAEYQARFAALGTLSLRRDAPALTADPRARRMLALLGAAPALVPPPDTGYPAAQAELAYRSVARLLAGELDLAGAARAWSQGKRALAGRGR